MLRYKEFQEELQPNFNSFNKQVRKLTLSPSAGIVPEDTRCIPVLHLSELSAFCWSRSQTDSVMRNFRLNIRKLISNEDGDVYETVSKKKEVALHQTLSVLSRLFNLVQFVKSWKFFMDLVLKDCIEVQEKKKIVVVMWPCSPNYVELCIFTS